ncbi:hypothetical protein [Sphingopyxis panaciterrulae]|uniref:Uncharacterized protein n=1 Tax=Sphingopyxis panaciterrulae TaxID=462372 RepID=A0A7W9B8K5_9SPHN|nr:hypothetical protein [Sphingopyxis panaciterrulae]MBB5708206.1 hypothetical protein [Sphingopyxis panaciterrulae]
MRPVRPSLGGTVLGFSRDVRAVPPLFSMAPVRVTCCRVLAYVAP